MIFAVDFDGTLCDNKYPEIGEVKQDIIDTCIRLKKAGHKLILNTCRTDEHLTEAIEFCSEHNLVFDAINENLPEMQEKYKNESRKIGADYYVDDKNLSLKEFNDFMNNCETIICPVCGEIMDETYRGTHYCKKCEEYLKG